MDIISMLNEPSAAINHTRPKVNTRNRTPWDAGGYSLPIVTRTDASLIRNIHYHVSPVETAEIFSKHKLSDSCSSLSSFTSSHSVPHSRLSSTSTLSGFHLFSQITADNTGTDQKTESHTFGTGVEFSTSPFSLRSQTNQSPSPTKSLDTLALIAENHFCRTPKGEPLKQCRPKSFEMTKDRFAIARTAMADATQSKSFLRPASPSDKILIKRPGPPPEPSDYHVEESFERCSPLKLHTDLGIPEQRPQYLSLYTRGHKRAASAPDFPSLGENLLEHGSILSTAQGPPNAELTPPSSQHPGRSSPADSLLFAVPNTPPETSSPSDAGLAPCLYMSNCDTNAPRRKAVSHIFGRNKMCTRLIPKEIWVYYCRKHYQRARYRNGKMWAKLQVELVSEQIRRLEGWSKESKRTETGGIVKDYSLAIRKREQMRLDEAGGLDRRKSKAEDDDIDSGEDEPTEAQDSSSPATAVPKWLRDLSGGSYNASKILEVVDRINEELLKGALPLFPDIEILPNIMVNDHEERRPPKGYGKRRSFVTAHKRSQSLGAALTHDETPNGRRMSQSSAWSSGSHNRGGLSQKRKRLEDTGEDAYAHTSRRLRTADLQVDIGRNGQHLARRSLFPDISEHEGPGERFSSRCPSKNSASLLTDPMPQRYNKQPMIATINSGLPNPENPYSDRPCAMHKRSQSDLSGLYSSRRTQTFSTTLSRYPGPRPEY